MMVEIRQWTEDLSVGIGEIDKQHQRQFALMSELAEALRMGRDNATCREIMDRLEDYTHSHFIAEEAAMQRVDYPHFAAHKSEHDRLMRQFRELQEELELEPGQTVDLLQALLGWLDDWLVTHIQEVDRQYQEYMQ